MKCEELLLHLNEYVDGTIDPEVCEQFEEHMVDCDPCQVVVDSIRKTIVLYKEGERYELPLQFKTRLRDTLRERWLEKHPQG